MDRWTGSRAAAWPWFVVFFCVVFAVGCQDGSGPNLVTSPEGGPTFEGAKPPPPPPPPAPPADPAIAFTITGRVRDAHGWRTAYFLKVMNADGTNLTSIYSPPRGSLGYRPAWSPDGRCIAFNITGIDPSHGLYLIDVGVVNGVPTGTNLRLFLPYPAREPAWSPLGNEIAYLSGNTLNVVPAAGGEPVVLYSSGVSLFFPTWSPDGSRIAFYEQSDSPAVRVVDRDAMTVTTVIDAQQLGEWPYGPSWARTQDKLTFYNPFGIYTMELPSGTPTIVCPGVMPDWSPDDGALVYQAGHTIMKVTLGTGVITQLMSSGSEDKPSWPTWRRFF